MSRPADLIAPPNLDAISSPVSLPRLQNAHISHSTSSVVHYLMAALDAPSLAWLDLTVYVSGGTLLLSDFPFFHAALHGSGVSLAIGLHAHNVPRAEWAQWTLTGFPATLPLSGVEEFHIQARQWDAPEGALPHFAAYMPQVSTLLIKNEPCDDDDDVGDGDNTEGHMELARVVARVLTSDRDGPVTVLFPHLAHLELIVSSIPLAFCELLARALAHREEGRRRRRRLRIRVDEELFDPFRWKMRWMGWREPEDRKTGIFDVDHVDVCEIADDFVDGSGGDEQRLGWGKWRDCVQRAAHEYWQE
ncbi:hypothetical protein GSI_07939 [Ganoderma sinense ZZ0214-1]|uniref:Uncharacterized protein n=1 Tax=Ganoderma sinense ZZ0214-1 TaxID=1077348 RepID=A0A2G8S8G5_9APHY|nr:hypothetical protein GSI_07939 [Ganoderma sinense ZZ0214-1]